MKIKQMLIILIVSCLLCGCANVDASQRYDVDISSEEGSISIELQGEEVLNTENLIILIYKLDGSKEDLIIEYDETIDPSSNKYYNIFESNLFVQGEYLIKIYSGSAELLTEVCLMLGK